MNALKFRPVACAVALLCAVSHSQSQTQTPLLATSPSKRLLTAQASTDTSTKALQETAAQIRLKREAPPNFSQSAKLIDRTLVWRGERKPAVVFVAQPGNEKAYALVPSSGRDFHDFLIGLGFERAPVEAYLRQPSYTLGEATCLPIEAAPQTCINVLLQITRNGEIDFTAQDADRKLIETAVESTALALVGSAQLSLGTSRTDGVGSLTGSSRADNLGFSTRGVASRGDARLEYDVTASSLSGNTQQTLPSAYRLYPGQPNTTTRVNLLAAGKRLGPDAGTVYAGLFQSDASQNSVGGNLFLLRPTILGLAWKSDGGDLSAFGTRQRVRLVLLSPSYVRILSQGAQVFEGQLQPGEQIVPFAGYGEPFVDVVVRDASGVEQRQRAEVLPAQADDVPAFSAGRNPHGFYVDIGRQVLQGVYDGLAYKRFEVQNGVVASAGYTYADSWGSARAGVQAGDGFTRVGASVSDRSLARQASAMVGTKGEYGASASYAPQLENGFQPTVSATRYKTNANNAAALAAVPIVSSGSLLSNVANAGCSLTSTSMQCYSASNYSSFTAGIGYRDFPVRATYSLARSGGNESERLTLQGTFGFNIAGRRSNLLTLLAYEPNTKAKSMLVSLIVPLEDSTAMATASVATDFKGNSSETAGYSKSFSAPEQEHLRSVSLSASANQAKGSSNTGAATAYVSSQLGAVANATSLSQSRNSTSAQTTFSMDYAVTPAGAAFTREDSGRAGIGGLFDGAGLAGVSIANNSQDPQTALVGGRSVEVPPNTNVYVPVGTGYLRGVTVSPGPALSEEQAKAGQYLYKGNVKSVVIADGFWVMARFETAGGQALPVQFTYKRPGEKLDRLYMDRQQRAMLFEIRDEGAVIERFVSTAGEGTQRGGEYRCTVPQSAAPKPGDVSTYQLLTYACTPAPGRSIVETDTPGQQATTVPSVVGTFAPPTESRTVPRSSQPSAPDSAPTDSRPPPATSAPAPQAASTQQPAAPSAAATGSDKLSQAPDASGRILLSVQGVDGTPLPQDTAVLRDQQHVTATAALGRVALNGLQSGHTYAAQLPDGQSCTFMDITLQPVQPGDSIRHGTARCG